jgi:tetratricopeptide (TPR) repeat protein
MVALAIAAVLLWSQADDLPPRLRQMLEARDFLGVEREIREKLAREAGWDGGHLLLAQIYLQEGRNEEAEGSAAAALKIRESLDAFLLLARATMRLNRLNDSIGWLEKAARRQPDYPETYKLLGLDYALGGLLPAAEQAFGRAVELGPGDWESQYYHGRTLFERGRIKEARERLRRAVGLNPTSAKAWTALGQTEERLGDPEAAESSYRKAVEACGAGRDCAWPLLQLGFLYGLRNDPEGAAGFYRRAVEARPDWARPHFHLGKALAAAGELAGARRELEEAVKLDEGRSEYHYQLAQVYRRIGEREKAREELARFRKLAKLEQGTQPGLEMP